jgi:glutathione-regulated potassium-efflux system ancillary protein KefF
VEAIALVYAHPYPGRSIACRALVEAAATLDALEVRALYSLYPDFDIDVAAERAALERAGLVVILHPLYWYSVPGMLKHYFDVVLTKGWAYGEGGGALAGKSCLWVTTTGGDEHAYTPEGRHHHAFAHFVPPVEQTMRYCGMHWLDPHVVHGAHELAPEGLAAAASGLRDRLARWREVSP